MQHSRKASNRPGCTEPIPTDNAKVCNRASQPLPAPSPSPICRPVPCRPGRRLPHLAGGSRRRSGCIRAETGLRPSTYASHQPDNVPASFVKAAGMLAILLCSRTFPRLPSFCDRHSDGVFVNVKAHVAPSLSTIRLLCMKLCAGLPGTTLDNLHTVRRVTPSQANIWSSQPENGRSW